MEAQPPRRRSQRGHSRPRAPPVARTRPRAGGRGSASSSPSPHKLQNGGRLGTCSAPGIVSRQTRGIPPTSRLLKCPPPGKAADYNSRDAQERGGVGSPASRPFRAALPAGSCSLATGRCRPDAAGGDSMSQRAPCGAVAAAAGGGERRERRAAAVRRRWAHVVSGYGVIPSPFPAVRAVCPEVAVRRWPPCAAPSGSGGRWKGRPGHPRS